MSQPNITLVTGSRNGEHLFTVLVNKLLEESEKAKYLSTAQELYPGCVVEFYPTSGSVPVNYQTLRVF